MLLHFSRAILLLLMDDESDIREQNSQTVLNLYYRNNLTLWSTQSFIPIYAQKLYLQTLTEKLTTNFDKVEILALILLIFLDENESNVDETNITEVSCLFKRISTEIKFTFIYSIACLIKMK